MQAMKMTAINYPLNAQGIGRIGRSLALTIAAGWLFAFAVSPALASKGAVDDILGLQSFRSHESVSFVAEEGVRGKATLESLNPEINSWFLLTLSWRDGGEPVTYHLENPAPATRQLSLDAAHPDGITLTEGEQVSHCTLWRRQEGNRLELAHNSQPIFSSLCDGQLLVRRKPKGHRTRLEKVTDLLRDRIWGGEQLVGLVKQSLYRDAFLEHGEASDDSQCLPPSDLAPLRARLAPDYVERGVIPRNLDLKVAAPNQALTLGCWYPVKGQQGIHLSTIEPRAIDKEILASELAKVRRLDSVERAALVYLVAFDLSQLELGFELGTDHPRLDWSDRTIERVRDHRLPGPDGFDDPGPLITTGSISADQAARTVATFTGGFKRSHSAFRYGELASVNQGSHYGFLSHGTLFSRLQPGLSTLYVLNDGSVNIKRWGEEDEAMIGQLRHARQNGVPLLNYDPESDSSHAGELVARWGRGNWSGSAEGKLRTLRAGACIQETSQRRFLIYGWFSSATPSAMTRVFQAYGCRDAMMLDMNALEHTYLALYSVAEGQIVVQHLIDDMIEVDERVNNTFTPRFIGYADNRDFFYLMRKESEE
jgi:hypothetical protein